MNKWLKNHFLSNQWTLYWSYPLHQISFHILKLTLVFPVRFRTLAKDLCKALWYFKFYFVFKNVHHDSQNWFHDLLNGSHTKHEKYRDIFFCCVGSLTTSAWSKKLADLLNCWLTLELPWSGGYTSQIFIPDTFWWEAYFLRLRFDLVRFQWGFPWLGQLYGRSWWYIFRAFLECILDLAIRPEIWH